MKDVSPPKTMRDTTNLLTAIRHQTRELSPLDASFAGQTMVLTGATGGICGRTARLLAEHGAATLVLGVRNLAKGERVAAELRRGLDPPPEVLLWPLDLASFASVRAFAARVAALPRLDVVMLGAGVMTNDTVVTEDGWEQTLEVIHLSCALLSVLVAPTLARSAAQRGTTGVLANVSSFAAFMARSAMRLPGARAQAKARPKPALLRSLDRVRPLLQQQQYMRAKLAHLVFLRALARRLAAPRLVDVHSVDPGICVTDLSQIHWFSRLMGRLGVYRPLEACARAVAHACVPAPGTNGAVMRDYEPIPYPKFMDSPKGKEWERLLWEETGLVLGRLAPEAKTIWEDMEAGKLLSAPGGEGDTEEMVMDGAAVVSGVRVEAASTPEGKEEFVVMG